MPDPCAKCGASLPADPGGTCHACGASIHHLTAAERAERAEGPRLAAAATLALVGIGFLLFATLSGENPNRQAFYAPLTALAVACFGGAWTLWRNG